MAQIAANIVTALSDTAATRSPPSDDSPPRSLRLSAESLASAEGVDDLPESVAGPTERQLFRIMRSNVVHMAGAEQSLLALWAQQSVLQVWASFAFLSSGAGRLCVVAYPSHPSTLQSS